MIRLLVVSLGWAVARAETCTALRGGPFTYEQESAPRDISAALRLVTGLINKELTAVVNVELPYVGDLIHAIVGEHTVRATVTESSNAAHCFSERGKPSITNFWVGHAAIVRLMMPITTSVGTTCPLCSMRLMRLPLSVPFFASSRSSSPTAMCSYPNSSAIIPHTLERPEPGPPSTNTTVGSSTLRTAWKVCDGEAPWALIVRSLPILRRRRWV